MHGVSPCWRSLVLQLLDRSDHPYPHRFPIQIPGLKTRIRLLGREDRRVLTVPVDQEIGRTVNIDLTWHCRSALAFLLRLEATPHR